MIMSTGNYNVYDKTSNTFLSELYWNFITIIFDVLY